MTKKKSNNILKIVGGVIAGVIVFVVALVLFLNRSSTGNEQVVTYEKSSDGITISLTYYAKGDRVYKQTAKNIIPYSALGVETEEKAREILDAQMASVPQITGYDDTLDYEDDKVIETVSIDYDVVDIEQVKDVAGTYFDGDLENGISLSKSTKWLEESGFTKVDN